MKKSSIFPLIRYESTIALFKVLNYFASDKKVNSKIQIKIPWFQSLWYHKAQTLTCIFTPISEFMWKCALDLPPKYVPVD